MAEALRALCFPAGFSLTLLPSFITGLFLSTLHYDYLTEERGTRLGSQYSSPLFSLHSQFISAVQSLCILFSKIHVLFSNSERKQLEGPRGVKIHVLLWGVVIIELQRWHVDWPTEDRSTYRMTVSSSVDPMLVFHWPRQPTLCAEGATLTTWRRINDSAALHYSFS